MNHLLCGWFAGSASKNKQSAGGFGMLRRCQEQDYCKEKKARKAQSAERIA
jgi:hypothetical protein